MMDKREADVIMDDRDGMLKYGCNCEDCAAFMDAIREADTPEAYLALDGGIGELAEALEYHRSRTWT
jgi:hypothetical protein